MSSPKLSLNLEVKKTIVDRGQFLNCHARFLTESELNLLAKSCADFIRSVRGFLWGVEVIKISEHIKENGEEIFNVRVVAKYPPKDATFEVNCEISRKNMCRHGFAGPTLKRIKEELGRRAESLAEEISDIKTELGLFSC